MSRRRYRFRKYLRLGLLILSLPMFGFIPARLMIATIQAPAPQAILTLGGARQREAFTAELAKNHADLDVWISSGLSQKDAQRIFSEAGVDFHRVHQDRVATDTVTNFTSIVDRLQQRNIQHVYLVTSDFHMPRAEAIATVILGSRGIRFTPMPVPSQEESESPLRIVRDIGRSIVWIFTGQTGAELRTGRATYKLNNQIFGQNERQRR
ncbi:YdcF family protein [filamentous cyanobacterium LEGE 11480]|uniref:YdcF family protein n=2 Tax=Romeriopsis TaxID=2992131 RepID=A0A928Z404_9CYAN|nr:YdcF family protein [Romeriopsis navalis LEGE 11480]